MKQKLLAMLVVAWIMLLIGVVGISRAHTIWRTRAWTWDLVHFATWGDSYGDDGPQSKVSGFISAPHGDRGGWHESDVLTTDEGDCDRVDIEPLLAIGYDNNDDFMAAISISSPGGNDWAEWAELDWADRHHKFWFEVEIVDSDTVAYVLYDCDDSSTVFDGTYDFTGVHEANLCHFWGYALSFEGYDTYIDTTFRGQFNEGDGTPWGYYRDNAKFSGEYFQFINGTGTVVPATISPFEGISTTVTTDPCMGPTSEKAEGREWYDFPSQENAPDPPDREPHVIPAPYENLPPYDQALMFLARKVGLVRLFEKYSSPAAPMAETDQIQAYMWTDAEGPVPTCSPTIRATPAPVLDIEIDLPIQNRVGAGWNKGSTACGTYKFIHADWRGPGTPCPPVGLVATVTGSSGYEELDYYSGTPAAPPGKRACVVIRCLVPGVGYVSDTDTEYLMPPPICTGWEAAAELCDP